jgi:hypothetical protein
MSKATKRRLIEALIIIIIGVISNIIIRMTTIASFSMFDTTNLFTYFGVLIGFSLTVYTFGLSMVSDIKSKIDANKKLSDDKIKKISDSLISGFVQIKEDIWLIFYSIITIVVFAVAKQITNPFGWDVVKWMLPETINLTLFITTTIAMWDIMKTLFNLGEINLELNKHE